MKETTTSYGPGRPPRIGRIFQNYDSPIFFVTLTTHDRCRCLANDAVQHALHEFAERGRRENRAALGRYVIMPDHVHLFVTLGLNQRLDQWVRMLKVALGKSIQAKPPLWQRGFFDHMLRNSDGYSQKWDYVRQNPVRAGLVSSPEEWPYHGELIHLRF